MVLHRISMDVLALFPKLMVKSGHDAHAAAAAATATAAVGFFSLSSLSNDHVKKDSDSEAIVCHGGGSRRV